MAANVDTGTVKSVRYCGQDYTVRPGGVCGRKQNWQVWCGEVQLTRCTPTRSKAVVAIHAHAVETGAYPGQLQDGVGYGWLVAAICR